MNSKYVFDYAYLAEASYTDFSKNENTKDSLTDLENGKHSESFANSSPIITRSKRIGKIDNFLQFF